MENASVVLAIVSLGGTWTLTVALFSWWLSRQFGRLEHMINRLIAAHKTDVDRQLRNMENRLLSCELRLFGFGPVIIDERSNDKRGGEG